MKEIIITLIAFCLLISSSIFGQDVLELHYKICQNCSTLGNPMGDQNVADSFRFTYDDTLNVFITRDITSDYGPRSEGSSWHKGVDFKPFRYAGAFNGGRGTAILTPLNGYISQYIRAFNGYLRVDVAEFPDNITGAPPRGFGYGHAFYRNIAEVPPHLRSGNFVVKRMIGSSSNRYAIIRLSSDSTQSNTAIGLANIDDDNPRVVWDGDTISVSNLVSAGDAIIPMGSSQDGRNPFPTHLHFDYFRDALLDPINTPANRLDPLLVVDHEMPEYSVEIFTKVDTAVSFSGQILYPGSSPTRLMVRPTMLEVEDAYGNPLPANGAAVQYSNVAYNVDDVEILLKGKADTAFATIRGPRVESRFSQGGRLNSALYPYNLNGVNVTVPILNYGNNNNTAWNKYGIRPHAYRGVTTGFPYDEYFYPAFITRIHREAPLANNSSPKIAHRPSDARYNDGPYQMMAKVTTVRDSIFTSDTLDFVLDNFKPYVESVSASVGDLLFYQRGWEAGTGSSCNGIQLGALAVNGVTLSYEDILTNGWTISAKVSEPLQQLTLSVLYENEACSPSCVDDLQAEWSDDGLTATFHVDGTTARTFCESSTGVKFQFSGYDYPVSPAVDPNQLLSFTSAHQGNTCLALPTRNASGWSSNAIPSGPDEVHYILNPNCGEGRGRSEEPYFVISSQNNCHSISGQVTPVSAGQNNGAISLSVTGLFDIAYSYSWSDGSTEANRVHLRPGTYTVTVSDGLCCEVVESFVVRLVPESSAVTASVTAAWGEDCAAGGIDIKIKDTAFPPFDIQWFDESNQLVSSATIYDANDPAADLFDVPTGIYTLVVTDALCRSVRLIYHVPIRPVELILSSLAVGACYSSGEGNGHNISLDIDARDRELNELNIAWSTGATNVTTLSNVPSGEYSVTVSDLQNICSVTETILICCLEINDLSTTTETTATSADGSVTFATNMSPFGSYLEVYINDELVDPALVTPNSYTVTGLQQGWYRLRLVDANGCSVEKNFRITRCTSAGFTSDDIGFTFLPIMEAGGYGRIEVTHPIVNPPYTYHWIPVTDATTNTRVTYQPLLVTDNSSHYRLRITDRCGYIVQYDRISLPGCNYRIDYELSDPCLVRGNFSATRFKWEGHLSFAGYNNTPVFPFTDGELVGVEVVFSRDNGGSQTIFSSSGSGSSPVVTAREDESGRFRLEGVSINHFFSSGAIGGSQINLVGDINITITATNGCVYKQVVRVGPRKWLNPTVLRNDGAVWNTRQLFYQTPPWWFLPQSSDGEIVNHTFHQSLLLWNNPLHYEPVVLGSHWMTSCSAPGTGTNYNYSSFSANFRYNPTYPNNPCRGGGKLTIPGFGAESYVPALENSEITIPSNSTAITLQDDKNNCACLFNSDLVDFAPFNNILPNFRYYVEFDCKEEELITIEIDANCSIYCQPGEDCYVGNSIDNPCTSSLFCIDDKGDVYVGLADLPPGGGPLGIPSNACYTIFIDLNSPTGGGLIQYGVPCRSDPCDFSGFAGVSYLYPEEMHLIEQNGWTACPVNDCYYEGLTSDQEIVAFRREEVSDKSKLLPIKGGGDIDEWIEVYPTLLSLSHTAIINIGASSSIRSSQLVDMTGRIVQTMEYQAEIKQGKIALSQGLSSGIYLVRVQLEDNSIHLRRIAIQ